MLTIFIRFGNKSIKYGIWTSSFYNNKKFNKAFNSSYVYFFFTPKRSGKFYGMAVMETNAHQNKEFAYWGEIGKWKGLMKVEWVLVKDLFFNKIDNLIENGEYVTELKDGSELSWKNASVLLEKMNENPESSSIFNHFGSLDKKEKNIRTKADSSIQTGMYKIFAEEHQKKKKEFHYDNKKVDSSPIVVVKKKMTQSQRKKLMKKQKKNQK